MTSRRPMTRSFSGNGRTSSFNEDDGSTSNGRSESRNTYLSNVRPENRSTLCTVMSQLTEDVQPTFETTLKSKAVSENCNVKFSCMVSGYPAPELKWYKDDMEMDRYCGLPKYEIFRNGKVHTLHIYNCTLDDAAIYQVSASNSKGIVSCSGVLEVGTMNEYKIHQRFFAKLKQKAEKKKKELEQQRGEKSYIQKEAAKISPQRPPRKRPVPLPGESPTLQQPETVEQLGAFEEANGVSAEVTTAVPVTSMDVVEEKTSPSVETLQKKIKISNGVDNGDSDSGRNHTMGHGGENCYDGGISLAQFLAETLQSQVVEEKQRPPRLETPPEMNVTAMDTDNETQQERKQKEMEENVKILAAEYERGQNRDGNEQEAPKETERERRIEQPHIAAQAKQSSEGKHGKTHKDHEHHHIPSISSMLHSVKDFFFGKGKKDSHDHKEKEQKEVDLKVTSTQLDYPPPQTLPKFWHQQDHNVEVHKPAAQETAPSEMDKVTEPSINVDTEKHFVSPEILIPHKHEDGVSCADLPPAHKEPKSTVQSGEAIMMEYDNIDSMEVFVEAESGADEQTSVSAFHPSTEVSEEDIQAVPVIQISPASQQEPALSKFPPEPNYQTATAEFSVIDERFGSPHPESPSEEMHSPTSTLTSWEDNSSLPHSPISETDGQDFGETPTEYLPGEEVHVDNSTKDVPYSHKLFSPRELCDGEKGEVKSKMQPYPDVRTSEITELIIPSLEEKTGTCDSETSEQVLSPVPLSPEALDAERDHLKEDIKSTPVVQEMHMEFLTTVHPATGGEVDFKEPQDCIPVMAGSTNTQNLSVNRISESTTTRDKEGTEFIAVCSSVGTTVDVNSDSNLKIQDHHIADFESAGGGSGTTFEEVLPEDTGVKAEEFICQISTSEAGSEGHTMNELGDPMSSANSNLGNLVWPKDIIPQIQISTVEDIPDIQLSEQVEIQNVQIIVPTIQVMAPEIEECTLPSAVLEPIEPQIPALIQTHHETVASEVTMIKGSEDDAPLTAELLPKWGGLQQDLSTTEEVKDVAQTDNQTGMLDLKGQERSGEELNQMDFSVPIVNVSCSDDRILKGTVDTQVPDRPLSSDTPAMPLFVVSAHSVVSHESAPITLANKSEVTGIETFPLIVGGANYEADIKMSCHPDKLQSPDPDLGELSQEKEVQVTPSVTLRTDISNVQALTDTAEDNIVPDILKTKPQKTVTTDSTILTDDIQKSKPATERLVIKSPTHPPISPASLRKYMSKLAADSDADSVTGVPVITVRDRQGDKAEEDLSGGSTPTSSLSCESSPRLKRRDSLSLIRSATPEELASGARRKIFIPKSKVEEGEATVVGVGAPDMQAKKDTPYMSPSQARRATLLQANPGQNTPPLERRSPLLNRRRATLDVPKVVEEIPTEAPATIKKEEKPAEKKMDPLKAPQVIRKIRGEAFPDASGHLKLWCQFFNVLSDSTIKWFRDEEEILEVKRSAGDESQVALAFVLASNRDCGVYGCTIENEYGTDSTDFLLSEDILSEILLRDDFEVGEEIEMTPLTFTRGLSDCGTWGEKYFGRIMTEKSNIGEGCAHKASRVKVIYGLDPVFESGSTCIIKVQSPIPFGTKHDSNLAERNNEISKQECRVQNMIREYCKIFAAEARVSENFGVSLEVLPKYLMYRPANSVPYASVEVDLNDALIKYCLMEAGKLIVRGVSEVEQKCCTFQHWIHQWTHGNLLVTRLEGVETKVTNIEVVTKSKGYQGLTEHGSPETIEQFLAQHQCNYYCGLLGLRPLKSMESLQQSSKIKSSKSPLLNRKLSPQLQRKGTQSPQMTKKSFSPKVGRKPQDVEDNKSDVTLKPLDTTETR